MPVSSSDTDPVADSKNTYIEISSLLADALVCLCRSYRGIGNKLRLFHNKLKTPCSLFGIPDQNDFSRIEGILSM